MTHIPLKLKKRLRALKELSLRGVGGEKANAREIYERLLAEHGIKDEEITASHKFTPPTPKKRRTVTKEEREAAEEIANRVRSHIDVMYPGMWENVASTARVSVRNCVFNEVLEYIATH